jgi:hypothetical protein
MLSRYQKQKALRRSPLKARQPLFRLGCVVILIVLLCSVPFTLKSQAAKPPKWVDAENQRIDPNGTPTNTNGDPIIQDGFTKPVDIYLTSDRVCKKCIGRYINQNQVELVNKKGQRGVYAANEIVGLDTHPIARKLFLHSLHEIGLPARIIVPQAFDNEPKYLHY